MLVTGLVDIENKRLTPALVEGIKARMLSRLAIGEQLMEHENEG